MASRPSCHAKSRVLCAVPRQIFLVLLDVAEFDVQRLLEQAVLRQRVEEELVREADELEIRPVRALPPVIRAKRPDDDALQLRAAGRIEHVNDIVVTLDRVQEDARPSPLAAR